MWRNNPMKLYLKEKDTGEKHHVFQADLNLKLVMADMGDIIPTCVSLDDERYELITDGDASDGYHKIKELYDHRCQLFAVICNTHKESAWKSKLHHDGTMYPDYFIVGASTPEGDYTYHYHINEWDLFDVKELEKAPEWDGHQPSDIGRLHSLYK